jgi:post-segregation antitoxin (ccd killing protein)
MKTKQPALIRVDGRASKKDIAKLKKHNINISALIREAIENAAKSLA